MGALDGLVLFAALATSRCTAAKTGTMESNLAASETSACGWLKGRARWNVNPTIAPPLFKIASHNALLANTLTEVEGAHCHVCRADVVDVEGLALSEIFLFILSILIS